jgi:ankyrin repeat protein
VEELAEVLAVDFDDVGGIPKLNPNWRWEDEEQALLTSCSSLIVIVEMDDSRVVQFSHFSVKEFLTSTRLADSSKDVSLYHIDLEPAHTIMAQACMGILLETDDCVEENGIGKSSSLAGYAARHWVTHAQFERVSSFLQKAMEYLFDLDEPYFAAWLELHNIDIVPTPLSSSLHFFAGFPASPPTSSGTPLYYASLCGFQNLVGHLAVRHPGHVNTSGGFYVTPLVAALAGRHFRTAKFLYHIGAHVDVRGEEGDTLLHSPALYGDLEMVQILLDYKVDVNAQRDRGWTPLHDASDGDRLTIYNVVRSSRFPDTIQLLLEHGADINMRALNSSTPLHLAAKNRNVEIVRMLLEHGANVGAKDNEGRTPLYEAVENFNVELVRMLLEFGANLGAKDDEGRTPLHKAAEYGMDEVIRVLLKRGANLGAKDYEGRTPFQLASVMGYKVTVKLLSEYGAKGVLYTTIPSSTSSLCLPW